MSMAPTKFDWVRSTCTCRPPFFEKSDLFISNVHGQILARLVAYRVSKGGCQGGDFHHGQRADHYHSLGVVPHGPA